MHVQASLHFCCLHATNKVCMVLTPWISHIVEKINCFREDLNPFPTIHDCHRPEIRVHIVKYFLHFSSKTYVVGTQKTRQNPKHMFKLMGKKIITILR